MNLSDEIRKQIEKNKGLKLAVGEINNHLSILENLVRKDIMEQVGEAYQKGFEDGKANREKRCDGCRYEHYKAEICQTCMNNYVNHWESAKQDDKIEVGDEVETKDGKRFVVTTFGSSIDGDIAVGVCADGLGLGVDLKELRKTGRHFDIQSILEDMRE